MIRLLLCLVVLGAASATVLMLRQQRNALQYECDVIHSKMIDVQRDLWQQQTQVAVATAPAALDATLAAHLDRARRRDQMRQDAAAQAPVDQDEWNTAWSDLPDRLDDHVESWEDLLAD